VHHPPLHLVVLNPDPEAVAEREVHRRKHGYGRNWSPRDFVEELRVRTPRLGLWLDSTAQTPADTVRTILARLHEAAVDEPTRNHAPSP
jgi:hypothetical protein